MVVSAPSWLLVALAFVPSLVVAARVLRGPAQGRPIAGERRRPSRPTARLASHGVAVAGAAGLGWSLLVLFSFQTHAGALYGQLGALVALFMLGLALGGAVVGSEAARFFASAERRPDASAEARSAPRPITPPASFVSASASRRRSAWRSPSR